MAEPVQNFRSAFHGFHREDVVRFLETTTAQHTEEVHQLKDEIQRLQQELEALREQQAEATLPKELEALQAENDALKAQVEELEAQLTAPASGPETDWEGEELAAYRRAEHVERQARNRAGQMYDQVNGLVADLAVRMEESKTGMDAAAEALGKALDDLQAALEGGQALLTQGAATLKTLRLGHQEGE